MSETHNVIPGSGYRGTSDTFNIREIDRPETRPLVPLGKKSYGAEEKPCMGFFTDTTVCIGCPVWHEARRELPFVFAASSAAGAGAAAAILTPVEVAGPARRLVVGGALAELVLAGVMKRRLGSLLAEPNEKEKAGRYDKLARAFTGAGAAMMGLAGRKSRAVSVAGGALVLAGAATERWSVFEASFQSARDPKYTVMPQRERLEAREG